MASITLRNIPDSVFEKLKLLSAIDRRSLNNEILMALESGVRELEKNASSAVVRLSRETQIGLWAELAGKWKGEGPKGRLVREIYADRTMGREVSL